MRRIEQPGPVTQERIAWAPAHGRRVALRLPAGLSLLEAVRREFAAAGFVSGVLRLEGAALGPFGYVMPALSRTPEHAAFYSDKARPSGVTRVETGAMTFGLRDGSAFFHCHALWREADGRRNGGHILPEDTILSEPLTVEAIGIDGACFVAAPDPETNFKLFGVETRPAMGTATDGRFFALRLRPNQDIAGALEAFCRERGVARAHVHGGVGSLIGARFTDGRQMKPFATEIAITEGLVEPDGQTRIAIAMVDYTGALAEGELVNGDNPVLMTFELVLEAL